MLPRLRMSWGSDATFEAPPNARVGTLRFTDASGNPQSIKLKVKNGEFTIDTNMCCSIPNDPMRPRMACRCVITWGSGKKQILHVVHSQGFL